MSIVSSTARFRLSVHISNQATEEELTFARQLGIPTGYCWVNPEQRNLETIREIKRRCDDAGIELWMMGDMSICKSPRIHLALPGRDEDIAAWQDMLRVLSAVGIGVTTFTWEANPGQVYASGRTQTRGADTRLVDMAVLRERPYTHGRLYSEDELWDNFAYFMARIMPVAEETGVRLALHPNDPPAKEPLGGVPPLIHSVESYRKAFEIANSPALGVEFCMGCWLEGGTEGFGDILAGIREFQADGRILIVHFRNISSPLPVFSETFLDNGYMDMYPIMRTLVETGYDGTITLDHTPRFVGDYAVGAGTAYAIGYMRALIERAEAELGA